MTTASTDHPRDLARTIVGALLGRPVTGLRPLTSGYVARTWRADVADRSIVIRLVRDIPDAFAADRSIGPLVAGIGIPVPELLVTGERDGWLYAISAFVPGHNADSFPPDVVSGLVPVLVRTMNAILRVDIAGTSGFGGIGPDGQGRSPSWRAHLATIFDDAPAGYRHDWRRELAGSRLDWDLFATLHAAMLGLLGHCPERRWLVHGDYGFGDFVWDAAWLRFWMTAEDLTEPLRTLARGDGGVIPAFDERMACYQLVFGMDALRVFARQRIPEAYGWATRRVSALLATLPVG